MLIYIVPMTVYAGFALPSPHEACVGHVVENNENGL